MEQQNQTMNFLDFEQPVAELEAKIEELRHVSGDEQLNIQDEIARLQKRSQDLTRSIFASLSPWQVAQIARHSLRPYTLDYIDRLFTDFNELHGDRNYADDPAIIAGLARFDDLPVAVVGHQKGRDIKERLHRNYGMPKPEGYRKALRVMRLAEKFGLPALTFIDTPGAYPGIGAEERGQSEAIARNLLAMSELRIPVVATAIDEGGSGGALAIGVGERLHRNYGMPKPEGYRKALRVMRLAEKFGLPALTFIDTPGAYPGIGAEERGQSEAIARNLLAMSELRIPVVATVIGEGGSGGALAIGVGDRLNMMQYSTYSVISPEGCASILWKNPDKAEDAAAAMGVTAARLEALGLVDQVVAEPLGGAHRDCDQTAAELGAVLKAQLTELEKLEPEALLEARQVRLRAYGFFR